MYRIIYIPTGEYVLFHNPQTIYAKLSRKERKEWKSHHRRPPQFWFYKPQKQLDQYLNVPDWVVDSIQHGDRQKMWKRLSEGISRELFNRDLMLQTVDICIQEFEFIKQEE